MVSDSDLISRVIADNDLEAFNSLVIRYQSNVRLFLRRITAGDHALADDVAQDTFLIALEKIHTFKAKGSFKAWLNTLAYHRFLRVIQTGANRFEVACDVAWQQLSTEDPVEADLVAEKLMSLLTVDERLMITLNVSEGLSHQDIHLVTEMPLGTIKSMIARAKKKLTEYVSASEVHVA